MKKKLIVLSGLIALAPFAFADAGLCTFQTGIQAVICKIGEILNTIIPILIVLGVVYFVWGVITYMINDDEEAKKRGKNKIIYGIIGLVVIVGMWGLVKIITSTFDLDNNSAGIETPCVPGTPGC
ncbi:MAG TPA: pilin [Candidatus Paceibacterota bacterium]|nr:pilin [Candidatus Paceibacterota bacterium]HPT18188.1 pilin [Candidatus Paceibacterota bacterium]